MKMWSGRFSKETDETVNDFNSSISFDFRLYPFDIAGSIAHSRMLAKCGIISSDDADAIVAGLTAIKLELDSGELAFDPGAEDIHMFIEQTLTERIGAPGKRLHTARSRNDQVTLDLKMYVKDQAQHFGQLLLSLLATLEARAAEHIDTVMPGYTHLQRAQPITFAHHLLAYAQMFMRDTKRLDELISHTDVMPLGSCAVAATTYPIDRFYTASLLGFSSVTENSIDGVSDRDYALEMLFDLSLIMMHLSRFSEEIILWCSSEFAFIELDDAFSTGSSIMPQKKNPDVAELIRGKCGRVYGDLSGLLATMKGLPLAYNKDMQEDKEALFDAIDNTALSIITFTGMLSTLSARPEKMRHAAEGGFICATDCADYLVGRGLPFRDAYKITGMLVAYCIENGKTFESLTIDEYRAYSDLFDNDIYPTVELENCLDRRSVYGGPSSASVKAQLKLLHGFISSRRK